MGPIHHSPRQWTNEVGPMQISDIFFFSVTSYSIRSLYIKRLQPSSISTLLLPPLLCALCLYRLRLTPQTKLQETRAEGGSRPELANERDDVLESSEERGRWAVLHLYEALRAGDAECARQLLVPDDIEWWFHGPKEHQRHLISLLSGDEDAAEGFVFEPQTAAAFGSTVVVEGCHRGVAWVHAWTVRPDGLFSQVREYFNTSVTVTRVGGGDGSASSSPSTCSPVWQSRVPERACKSLPGLVLAI